MVSYVFTTSYYYSLHLSRFCFLGLGGSWFSGAVCSSSPSLGPVQPLLPPSSFTARYASGQAVLLWSSWQTTLCWVSQQFWSPPIFHALKITLKFHLYVTLISHLDFLPVIEWTRSQSKAMILTLVACTFSMGQMMLGGLAFVFREWRTLQLVLSVPFFVFFLSSRYELSLLLCLMGTWDENAYWIKIYWFSYSMDHFVLFGPKTHVSHLFTLWDLRFEKQNTE